MDISTPSPHGAYPPPSAEPPTCCGLMPLRRAFGCMSLRTGIFLLTILNGMLALSVFVYIPEFLLLSTGDNRVEIGFFGVSSILNLVIILVLVVLGGLAVQTPATETSVNAATVCLIGYAAMAAILLVEAVFFVIIAMFRPRFFSDFTLDVLLMALVSLFFCFVTLHCAHVFWSYRKKIKASVLQPYHVQGTGGPVVQPQPSDMDNVSGENRNVVVPLLS
eukprot:GHVS01005303.1.p1 GENE.GHVS01005303.1~~GHVS01005303.1.p1  ORF type:complete len:220 (+),score=25.11 GHVS01005303.1:172-831(+)